MKAPILNCSFIQNQSPKAWKDFLNFYSDKFNKYAFLQNVKFEDLPFEMQLGIFLHYFIQNGIELDICNTDYSILPDTILEAFSSHEKNISHYS